MKTNRERARELLNKLQQEDGIHSSMILDYLINDYMEGSEAYEALLSAEKEFFGDEDDYDDENYVRRFKEND